MNIQQGSNVTIQNLALKYGYVRQPNAPDTSMGIFPDTEAIEISGMSNVTVTNLSIDNKLTALRSTAISA